MATPFDLEFLKLAIQNGVFDRPTAEKCLEIVDLGTKRGQALSAPQVAINLAFLEPRMADAISAMVRASQTGTQPNEEGEGAFAIDGFELRSKLGRGPCGATYDARHIASGQTVALKVLTRKFARHPRTFQAILNELRPARGFDQATAVALRDVLEASGRSVLVYDRVSGRPLHELLAPGPLDTLRSTDVAIELARCLAAAHARGLVHGDIRPAKVLVEAAGPVRLADFGLAHAACLAAGFGQVGIPFGHPEYLAPEVVQERLPRPTPATDVYALGILLYELCCGRPPHRGPTHRDTLRLHLVAALPPPPANVHISSALAALIILLTTKDPRRRPRDMRAALDALEAYKKARTSGKTSDPAEEVISNDDWGRASAGGSSHSDDWNAEKIEKAEPVGPEDFAPGEAEDESYLPGVFTGRRPSSRKALDEAAAGFLADAGGSAPRDPRVARNANRPPGAVAPAAVPPGRTRRAARRWFSLRLAIGLAVALALGGALIFAWGLAMGSSSPRAESK